LTQNPKSTLNPKSFQAHILFFRHFQGQKTSTLNSPHYIESFNTKIDHFSDHNHHQLSLFLSTIKFNDSLSLLSPKKDWKIRKIKFGIKIIFLKIKGTGYLIDKNYRGLKWAFITNFKPAIYSTHPFQSSFLYFNPTLPLKKYAIRY
jgi:hypothetical protein